MSPVPARRRQTFRVHSFEVDRRGRLAPAALCAFLQEAAGRDAHELGVGMGRLLEQGLAWMLQRLVVEVAAWPIEQDEIAVRTWPSRFGGASAERSFAVEGAEGRTVAKATSRWAVVDLRARRAVRMPDFIRTLAVAEAIDTLPAALPDPPTGAPVLGEARLHVRRADLDVVGHANNTRYVEWALEAVPDDWIAAREIVAFDVTFRREARQGDSLAGLAFLLDDLRLGHEVRLAQGPEVLATLETRWRVSAR